LIVLGTRGADAPSVQRHPAFVWDLGYGFKANEREGADLGALIPAIALTVCLIIAYAVGVDDERPFLDDARRGRVSGNLGASHTYGRLLAPALTAVA